MGTEQREVGIRAFTKTVRLIFLVELCLSIIPLFVRLLMPNYYLGKTQNVVDGMTNGGVVINEVNGRDDVIVEELVCEGVGRAAEFRGDMLLTKGGRGV